MAYKSEKFAGDRDLVALGQALRSARKERGLSQESLAADAGVERSYMGAIERGEVNVTLIVLLRICKELKIKPSQMMVKAML